MSEHTEYVMGRDGNWHCKEEGCHYIERIDGQVVMPDPSHIPKLKLSPASPGASSAAASQATPAA